MAIAIKFLERSQQRNWRVSNKILFHSSNVMNTYSSRVASLFKINITKANLICEMQSSYYENRINGTFKLLFL